MTGFITGQFGLDWGILALSLFNMVLLLWLGATVVLNAERRTWGHALAGGGLLLAMKSGLKNTGIVRVSYDCESGEEAVDYCLTHRSKKP